VRACSALSGHSLQLGEVEAAVALLDLHLEPEALPMPWMAAAPAGRRDRPACRQLFLEMQGDRAQVLALLLVA